MPAHNRKLPPYDSWITLEPGRGVTLDAASSEEWTQKTRIFREIRGNILSSCFSVEFSLDRLISEFFFPGVDTAGNPASEDEEKRMLRDLFDELFLEKNRLSFASKIQLIRSLLSKSMRLSNVLDRDWLPRLDTVREVRNRFAHYPVSFFPQQGDDGKQILIAKLVCRDKDVSLDQAFFDSVDANFRKVEVGLREVLTALRGEASDTNEQS